MSSHFTTTAPGGSVSFQPTHPLQYGECGWWGRPLTLEELTRAEGVSTLDGFEIREVDEERYFVLSYCQFVGPSVEGAVLFEQQTPEVASGE